MAVEIITKNRSSYQEAMNLLAACYAWNNVVYDAETTTNVTQLWASEKVYLDFTDGRIYVKHIDGYVVTPISLAKSSGNIAGCSNAILSLEDLLNPV